MDRVTVYRWEKGLQRPENVRVVERFAAEVEVDLDEALTAADLRAEPVAPRHRERMDPDVLLLQRMMADPDTPESIKVQVRAMLRALAKLADAHPERPTRRRTGS